MITTGPQEVLRPEVNKQVKQNQANKEGKNDTVCAYNNCYL